MVFYEANRADMSAEKRKKTNENIGIYKAILLQKNAQEWKDELEDASNRAIEIFKELNIKQKI
jgi:hypothetical protein